MPEHLPRGRGVRRAILALAGLALLVFVAEAAHRTTDIVRGSPVDRLDLASGAPLPPVGSPDFLHLAAALTGVMPEAGNAVRILTDEGTFDALLADLAAARTSITLLVYFCRPGPLADRVMAILTERARAGVDVLVLADGFGCQPLLAGLEGTLRPAGVRVATLRPLRWWAIHRAQHRNHSRLVVVDGRVAYTGGFGLADAWVGNGGPEPPWRDTSIRVEGPVVTQVQAAFAAAWAEATGELPVGPALFPRVGGAAPAVTPGSTVAGFLASGPGVGTRPAERYLILTIAGARRTLYLANSYFVPPPAIRRTLVEAARRGVDVRVLVPGPRIDVPMARLAGRSHYRELLEAGVRIWEYEPAMMHAKTLVADGHWVGIGSLNLDNRSLRLNDESTLLVHDGAVGTVMDSLFLVDLERSREVLLPAYRVRPFHQRVLESLARLVAPLL